MAWKNVQYENGKYRTSEGGGGGGSSTLSGLDDVNISNVQNGDALEYDSATSKWKNKSKGITTRFYADTFEWKRGSSSGGGSTELAYTYTSAFDGWCRTWAYLANSSSHFIAVEAYIYNPDDDTEWQMDITNGNIMYHTWNVGFPVKKGDIIRIKTRFDGTGTLPTADFRIFG